MAAAGSFVREFCEETTCPICLDHFTDPVTIDCGHNFCRACLTQYWGEPKRSAVCCPHCREPVQHSRLRPNRQLASIVEITKKFSLRVAQETESTSGGVCAKHQEPLKLFCREDRAPICLVCDRSKEHKQHHVIPAEEAAEEFKEEIQAQLKSLEKKREELAEQKLSEEQRHQEFLKQLAVEKQEILSAFEKMHKFLDAKEYFWLIQLADLEKETKKRQEENLARLSEEISHFRGLIKDVEGKYQQPSSEFLQEFGSTFSRCQQGQERQRPQLSPGLEWKLRSFFPKSSNLKKAMEEFKGSLKEVMDKVNVTLDPSTAHVDLVVSEDLKSVRWDESIKCLLYNPERFKDECCVLGLESFGSGRHWWEVEVEGRETNSEWWAVGVAKESLKKDSCHLSTDDGIWAVGKDSFLSLEGLAFTSPKPTTLTFRCELRKILLSLDYEQGRVEFFDADSGDLIFAFSSVSFSGERIHPFFWVNLGTRLTC